MYGCTSFTYTEYSLFLILKLLRLKSMCFENHGEESTNGSSFIVTFVLVKEVRRRRRDSSQQRRVEREIFWCRYWFWRVGGGGVWIIVFLLPIIYIWFWVFPNNRYRAVICITLVFTGIDDRICLKSF